jgi:hypothetical protein
MATWWPATTRIARTSGSTIPVSALPLRQRYLRSINLIILCYAAKTRGIVLLPCFTYLESSIQSALCRRVEDTSGLCSGRPVPL